MCQIKIKGLCYYMTVQVFLLQFLCWTSYSSRGTTLMDTLPFTGPFFTPLNPYWSFFTRLTCLHLNLYNDFDIEWNSFLFQWTTNIYWHLNWLFVEIVQLFFEDLLFQLLQGIPLKGSIKPTLQLSNKCSGWASRSIYYNKKK